MSAGLQRLREDAQTVRDGAIKKGEDPTLVDRAIALDVARREAQGQADALRNEKKGVSERIVVYKHALRNAILPLVTVAGVQVGHLLAGAVLVETVFGWPGMGRLAYESILRRDAPLMLGILFCSALLVILANLATDLLYSLIDPRIRTR